MRFSLLLPAALLALSGCVAVTRSPEPASTTIVAPAPTYAAPVTSDTTTTTTKRWGD
ncbi:MAG: hypothetical protein ABSE20_09510 [Acetobacteraceae bacterium]|jgi:hypothetical protein